MATKLEPVTAALFGGFQIAIILLYAFLVEYADDAVVQSKDAQQGAADFSLTRLYPFWQDVHVIVFIGFGFLMTFMRKYSLSAVAFNMLIAAFMLQWTILVFGFWHKAFKGHGFFDRINVTPSSLVTGDFGAATVLISFGALLGKAGPTQLLVMGIFEIIVYGLNEAIGVFEYQAVDMGGSMYIHLFGAVFGVAASRVFMSAEEVKKADTKGEGTSSRTTDTFAMVGTLFLFVFWPSFNGALASGTARNRVVINTVMSISASTTGAFLMSFVLRGGKFSMVDIQNATLAGGVAVGSSSDLVVDAWPSLLIGFIAGMVSVVGYVIVQPALEKGAGIHDTCGVLNLHGIPGVIGGVSSAISASQAGRTAFGSDIGLVYPARAGGARSSSYQAAMQTAALFTTIALAAVGGAIAGAIIKAVPNPGDDKYAVFDDARYWEECEEEEDVKLEIDEEKEMFVKEVEPEAQA